MAHFAEVNEEGIVVRVIKTDNDSQNEGYDWLVSTFSGIWIKTSYNTSGGKHLLDGIPLRKNFAGKGYGYDSERDAFIPPKTFESWVLNEDTCLWEPPIQYPNDENLYFWDESSISWIKAEPQI